ncbi:hypothetical protein DMR_00950 [Solidesulfovibrio magneticus RS-1]|uniref:Uncharacterized protein n=1 Tax=Solidesulfovibrio magneticus (strain ATCC 700980 / DSM 13731 / RS-1) TaxID=573370 RepID=C4XTS1_SOLM1|nr:hypothetical protein DMR_00950 [Solidesulfovibrio magneticus RS-1]
MSQALEKPYVHPRRATLERDQARGTKAPGQGERPRKGAYRANPGGVRAGGEVGRTGQVQESNGAE